MIKNPSFEGITRPGGWTRCTHTGQEYGEIYVPEGWIAWWEEGQHRRPEVKVIPKQAPFLDPLRIYDGDWGVQAFTFYGRMHAGLYQEVSGLTPGKQYELSAHAHAWSTHPGMPNENDPHCSAGVGCGPVYIPEGETPPLSGDPVNDAIGNFLFRVGVSFGDPDPFSGVTWGAGAHIYNGFYQTPKLQFTAPANGQVVVYLKAKSLWTFRTSDAYWDMVELKPVDDPVPPPPYESTMLILPQDATPKQLQEVFTLAYPNRRTFGFSHDDAGNLNGTAILYNIPDSEKESYLAFYATRYPDVKVEFAYTSDWEEPSELLWQCDPGWKNEKIASPGCSKTLCQTGCWISSCAMAQRYFGIKSDATPFTANQALGDALGFSGCMTLWTPMKEALGLEVVKRSYDPVEVQEWLDTGNVCFAEVEPETYQHFVLVTRYSEGRFWMLDPYKNVEGWVDEYYPGVESWRLIRPFDASPLPVRGSLVSLHLQSLVEGALNFVARVEPSVVKIFQLEVAKEIKARSPKTLVVLRYFTGDQNLDGDLQAAAQAYVRSFQDSLETNAEWIDFVESYNETVCSNNAGSIRRAVEFDCHFADALMALGLPVAPQLLNVAVGNPLESEVELLLPAVEQVIKYGGTLGYHAYGYAPNGANLNDAWQYYAGRALEGWDPVFRAHGLYPKYIFGECGAFATCNDGWRALNCLNGDWPLYLDQLTEFSDRLKAWNAENNNRCLGGTLFTSGGWGWASWEITRAEMEDSSWPR